MSETGFFGRALRPTWSAAARVAAVRRERGAGLGRAALAALVLAAFLAALLHREVGRYLDHAPAVAAQLPTLVLRDGTLETRPPLTEPLVVHGPTGDAVAIIDLAGRTDLADSPAEVLVTRTRVLVKGVDGQVQAFPLGGGGRHERVLGRADLLDLAGTLRWLVPATSLPFLYVFALILLLALHGMGALLALVPELIYRVRLDGAARLRLASLGLPAAAAVSGAALWAGLTRGLFLLALGVNLVWILLGTTALGASGAGERDSPGADGRGGRGD